MSIHERILEYREEKFRDFNARLIPNIEKDSVIGVKTPHLKQIAKELIKSGEAEAFINKLPHQYFEENQIHAFIISSIKDFDRAVLEVERFLPYVDNWATCDQMIVKAFAKEPEKLLDKVDEWLKSDEVYTVRFGIGILMRYFLEDRFKEEYLLKVAGVKTGEYYIDMMAAWYYATALAKQYDAAIVYIEENRLDKWVHNKTISKARESFRVLPEHKKVLKGMVRKEKI